MHKAAATLGHSSGQQHARTSARAPVAGEAATPLFCTTVIGAMFAMALATAWLTDWFTSTATDGGSGGDGATGALPTVVAFELACQAPGGPLHGSEFQAADTPGLLSACARLPVGVVMLRQEGLNRVPGKGYRQPAPVQLPGKNLICGAAASSDITVQAPPKGEAHGVLPMVPLICSDSSSREEGGGGGGGWGGRQNP